MTHPADSIQIDLGARSYPYRLSALPDVPAHLEEVGLRTGRCLLVTDRHVDALHRAPLETALREAGWTPRVVVVEPGEATKSYAPLHDLYDAALTWGIDRKTPILALGGGVVGDLAGFAAATLLRGLPLVQLPTTVIAQVDSALGGKTGINHTAGKNLIGAFHQPVLVAADPSVLQTLPEREWTSGLAEVVKHALIADAEFAETLRRDWDALLQRPADQLPALILRAAAIKAEIVSQDEREQGRRALLNFGHTFGHAIERTAGYGRFTHGEAVALGMRAALHYSQQLHPEADFSAAFDLVGRIPVPEHLRLPTETLVTAMHSDKKVEAGTLRLVLLRAVGDAYVRSGTDHARLAAAWAIAKR